MPPSAFGRQQAVLFDRAHEDRRTGLVPGRRAVPRRQLIVGVRLQGREVGHVGKARGLARARLEISHMHPTRALALMLDLRVEGGLESHRPVVVRDAAHVRAGPLSPFPAAGPSGGGQLVPGVDRA